MDLINAIDIAASGMKAQRARINVISSNLANANTTRTEDGSPYRRKTVIFQTGTVNRSFEEELKDWLSGEESVYGVQVTDIVPVGGNSRSSTIRRTLMRTLKGSSTSPM